MPAITRRCTWRSRLALFFLLENGKRLTLAAQNGDYASQGPALLPEELMERADQLSPNALLRPVVQDYMLPTVAYIGGPAEMAYLAQSEVIYQRILGRMPVALPRSGFTVLDAHSRKLMERTAWRWPISSTARKPCAKNSCARWFRLELANQIHSGTRVPRRRPSTGCPWSWQHSIPRWRRRSRRAAARSMYQLSKIERKVDASDPAARRTGGARCIGCSTA